jgi:hypothetical protein
MKQIKHQLQPVVSALQFGFQSANAFEQMLFDGGPEHALHAAISGGSARVGDYHQPHAAFSARLAVIRIWMSALLAKYHLYQATIPI